MIRGVYPIILSVTTILEKRTWRSLGETRSAKNRINKSKGNPSSSWKQEKQKYEDTPWN